MKRLTLALGLISAAAMIAPAASAKTSIRQAERACVAAAKERDDVKSARASDEGKVITNSTAQIQLRVRHEDGSRSVLVCKLDRSNGEISSLEAAE